MKILILSQYFWPQFRINDIANFLKKKDKVYVVTSIPSYPNKKYFKNFNNKRKIRNLEIFRTQF